jgi:hypothetical protein
MFRFFFPSLCVLLLASCGGQTTVSEAEAPTATVLLRNGTKLVGKVVESSPKQIKIAVAGNPPQTFLMADVKRVEYAEAAPPPATAPAPAAGGAPAATPPSAPAPEVAHDDHPHPVATAVTTRTNSLPVGTEISVRNEETIDSGKAVEGQRFAAEVIRDVKDADGDVVIPRGANAQIVIRSASKGGKIRGASDLILDLETVSVDGKQYTLSTADLAQKGRDGVGANKRTAEFAGGGAAIGAIIGAIAGGGKGAAIGAGSGAGGGALAQVLTKGGSIKVPVETVLTFKLDRRLRVAASE